MRNEVTIYILEMMSVFRDHISSKSSRYFPIITGTIILLTFLYLLFIRFNKLSSSNKQVSKISPSLQMETSPVTATIDNRILLSSNNLSQYNRWTEENCQEDFYADPPNQWVTYSNPNIEITFQVPFNPHWGSSRFRINPYDEYQPYIQFGPYYIGEACAWSRSYYLKPVPRLSIIEAQSRIEHDPDMQLIGSEFEINELKVIKYIESNHIVGGCVSPTFQISGKSFNYILSSECSPNPDKDFNLLEEVLRTVGIRS